MPEVVYNQKPKIETYSSYKEGISFSQLLLMNPIKVSIIAKIKAIEFDNIPCYSIELKDSLGQKHIYYFEKETGLLRRYDNNEISYKFNVVDSSYLELPD